MAKARILKVKDGITWEEFKVMYRGLFRVSSSIKAEAAMAEEFKRLTSRDPYAEPRKQNKRPKLRSKSNTERAQKNDSAFSDIGLDVGD